MSAIEAFAEWSTQAFYRGQLEAVTQRNLSFYEELEISFFEALDLLEERLPRHGLPLAVALVGY